MSRFHTMLLTFKYSHMKIVLLSVFAFACLDSFCQIQKVALPNVIKIGETKYMGQFLSELSYTVSNNDTSYSILFKNAKYSSITDLVRISFENSPGILDTLYQLLINGFDLDKGKQSTFVLGKDFIAISSDKAMGIKFIQIMAVDKKSFFYLRKKQLNELFNRSSRATK